MNRAGAPALAELPALPPVSPYELKTLLEQEIFALDIRPNTEFAEARMCLGSNQYCAVPASLHRGRAPSPALGLGARPVLVADTPEQYAEAAVCGWRALGIEDPRISP